MSVDAIQRALLDWYDRNARVLPWRAPPGRPRPLNPYPVWLAEIMLQQTMVAAVIPYYRHFLDRWPDVQALAAADDGEVMAAWAGLGYYARARNLLACARQVVAEHGGRFPASTQALARLRGIGDYTSAAIAAIAFDTPCVPVDGNVERVATRLFALTDPLPRAKAAIRAHAATLAPARRSGDFAQALMDLGATVCTPRAPRCEGCPVAAYCRARAAGIAAALPHRTKAAPRPVRRGIVFWLERDGHVFTVVRPGHGLLAGMRALPSSEWSQTAAIADLMRSAPVRSAWTMIEPPIRHVFTHFELQLVVARADDTAGLSIAGDWVPIDDVAKASLPTLFRKAWSAVCAG